MGGFRTIAAKIGLTPGRSDNRGRPKKAEAAAKQMQMAAAAANEEEQVEAAARIMGMMPAGATVVDMDKLFSQQLT